MKKIEKILLSSGKFYAHIDESIVCKTCEQTLDEGCDCWEITVKEKQ